MQLVLPGAIGQKLVFPPAQLLHHAAQGEDGAEDELGIVGILCRPACRRWQRRRVGGAITIKGSCKIWESLLVPAFGVDAIRCSPPC